MAAFVTDKSKVMLIMQYAKLTVDVGLANCRMHKGKPILILPSLIFSVIVTSANARMSMSWLLSVTNAAT
jgi:hypothetical protein